MSSGSSMLRTLTFGELDAVDGLVHGFERRGEAREGEGREQSRLRVAAALAPLGTLYLLDQVHGADVRQAPWPGRARGDAGVTSQPGTIVGVETADCLPILIVDPVRRIAAAVHAGWRGSARRVAAAAVAVLRASGCDPAGLVAALGPAIGACCYEVGDEVRNAFAGSPEAFRPGPRGRAHFDVRRANRIQLVAAGVREDHICSIDDCTRCRPELYHSYRRDAAGAGRMISFVGWRG